MSTDDLVVAAPPSLARLYARSLAARRPRGGDLTSRVLVREGVRLDPDRAVAHARACGDPSVATGTAPLLFPHLLGFGLQVQLMVTEPFPFRLLGLVHVRQEVTAPRRLRLGERCRVRVHAERLAAHPRGATVDLVTRCDVDGEPVWEGRSTYLARAAGDASLPTGGAVPPVEGPADAVRADGAVPTTTTALWRVPADTGRRYAAVSGDVNPIHLSALAARALGFPRAIAHGMWTLARTVAALEPRLPDAVALEAGFRRPVLLPGTVALAVRPAPGGGWDAAVRSRSGDRVHLVTTVRPLT